MVKDLLREYALGVLCEAEEADAIDPRALKINPRSNKGLRLAASIRLQGWLDEFSKHESFASKIEITSERTVGAGKKVIEFEDHPSFSSPPFKLIVLVSYYNPIRPTVKPQALKAGQVSAWARLHPNLPPKFEEYVVETLMDVVSPENHNSGLWWADENLYMIRPLYEGEDPTAKPMRGWSLIDPMTQEEKSGKDLKFKYDVVDPELNKYMHSYKPE